MKKREKTVLMIAAFAIAIIPLFSQASQIKKPSFEVISIKPSAPLQGGAVRIGGGTTGDRYTMTGVTLRMLLQNAYSRASTGGPIAQLQIIGGPNWIDSDRYDIQARADCSGGVLSREQVQVMIQSMLEDRFQLKAHMETRELPTYNLVVAKDGPKIKASADQTPPSLGPGGQTQPCSPPPSTPSAPAGPPPPPAGPGQRGDAFSPNTAMPRGAIAMRMSPTGLTLRASAAPVATLVNMLQQQVGREVIDKTGLTGLFDFTLEFSREGLPGPGIQGFGPAPVPAGPGPAGTPPTSADPVPSLFTAIQDLGLRLESAKGPVDVLVMESVQKPTEN